ncbi:hypothetical protein TcasGA2_TC034588 [Tribolium castaneum]|uniref:Uncharacterized protein n=1 Tax=Tribolium castaneum TaxID=7070 RepID=A0A139WL75_TRICA|nr:hypothetical protein TcasGA2_TC034588 [Tribolium castaneum]
MTLSAVFGSEQLEFNLAFANSNERQRFRIISGEKLCGLEQFHKRKTRSVSLYRRTGREPVVSSLLTLDKFTTKPVQFLPNCCGRPAEKNYVSCFRINSTGFPDFSCKSARISTFFSTINTSEAFSAFSEVSVFVCQLLCDIVVNLSLCLFVSICVAFLDFLAKIMPFSVTMWKIK